MSYAVIKTGGKQYRINKGDTVDIDVPKEGFDEKGIQFDQVLLYSNDGSVKIGTPYLNGFNVKAKLVENITSDKIRVGKFRAKSRHRRIYGHKSKMARVLIEEINTK